MTKLQEQELSLEDKTTIYALDIIAGIVYQSKINIQQLEFIARKIPQSSLKDVCLLFEENQKNWLNKVIRAAKNFGRVKGIDIAQELESDINGDGLHALFNCISRLKMCRDLDSMDDILDRLVPYEDLSDARRWILNYVPVKQPA